MPPVQAVRSAIPGQEISNKSGIVVSKMYDWLQLKRNGGGRRFGFDATLDKQRDRSHSHEAEEFIITWLFLEAHTKKALFTVTASNFKHKTSFYPHLL